MWISKLAKASCLMAMAFFATTFLQLGATSTAEAAPNVLTIAHGGHGHHGKKVKKHRKVRKHKKKHHRRHGRDYRAERPRRDRDASCGGGRDADRPRAERPREDRNPRRDDEVVVVPEITPERYRTRR